MTDVQFERLIPFVLGEREAHAAVCRAIYHPPVRRPDNLHVGKIKARRA